VIAMTLTLVAVFAPLRSPRTHRAPVHRVRARACRCGAGVGFCRADLVADDVQQAALTSGATRPVVQPDRRVPRRHDKGYARSLAWVLSHRWLVLMVWVLVVAVGGLMFSLIRSELAPLEDRA